MVRALHCVVWCSQGRLEKRTNKKTQWQINVPGPTHPDIQQTRQSPEPLYDRGQLVKKLIQLHTFQYIQKHPIYPFTCYSRTKQEKKEKGQNTERCFHLHVFLCLLRGAPCSVNSWHDRLCTNTAGPTALLHTVLSSNQGYIL